jgi:hypothetical protein
MRSLFTAGLAVALVVGCSDDTTGNGNQQTAAPTNIQAAIVGDNVVLTWDSVPGATSYRVYMAAEAGVRKSNIQQLLENMFHPDLGLQFDHPPGLQAGIQYFFVVTAVGPDGESTESCEIGARIGTGTGGSC